MKKPHSFMTSISVAALLVTGIGIGIGSSSASAAAIGSGRAIIRIDAPSAQVDKKAFGSYTLTIPTGSTGQWMGDRPGAAGASELRVGNVSAKQLSSKWKNFSYTGVGAQGALTWNTGGKKQYASVRIARPSVTASGVTFAVLSQSYIPAKLKNVTINLQRAPQKMMRTDYEASATLTLSADLQVFAGIYATNTHANVRIFNNTNHNTSWSHSFDALDQTVTVPDGTCDNIQYAAGSSTYGFSPAPANCANCYPDGSTEVTFGATLTPKGEAAFSYYAVVITYLGW